MIKQAVYIYFDSQFSSTVISKVVHHTLLNHAGLVICPQHAVKISCDYIARTTRPEFEGNPLHKIDTRSVECNITRQTLYRSGNKRYGYSGMNCCFSNKLLLFSLPKVIQSICRLKYHIHSFKES